MYIFRNYVQAYVNIIYIIYCMFIYLSRYHLTLRLFMRLVLCMFFVPLAVFLSNRRELGTPQTWSEFWMHSMLSPSFTQ